MGRTRRHAIHIRTSPLQLRYVAFICVHPSLRTPDPLLFYYPYEVSLNFETRPIAGKPPAPRGYHAALIADSRLFIFGGFNGNEVYDDVYNLDLAGAAYLPQVTSFAIDVD